MKKIGYLLNSIYLLLGFIDFKSFLSKWNSDLTFRKLSQSFTSAYIPTNHVILKEIMGDVFTT